MGVNSLPKTVTTRLQATPKGQGRGEEGRGNGRERGGAEEKRGEGIERGLPPLNLTSGYGPAVVP